MTFKFQTKHETVATRMSRNIRR